MSEVVEQEQKVGVLNARPGEPVKSLLQPLLAEYPGAVLINPPDEYAEEDITEELVDRYNPGSFDIIFHDSDPDAEMGRFCRDFMKRAVEKGAFVKAIDGRRGE